MNQLVRPWIERSLTMKVSKLSMLTAVVLSVVTVASWIGQAEAQHRGGKPAAAPRPKAGPPPGAGKMHPPQPKAKAKAQPKANGGMAKAAQKKKAQRDST
jgi:hypothetical protein